MYNLCTVRSTKYRLGFDSCLIALSNRDLIERKRKLSNMRKTLVELTKPKHFYQQNYF